jgi:hypothetical protein
MCCALFWIDGSASGSAGSCSNAVEDAQAAALAPASSHLIAVLQLLLVESIASCCAICQQHVKSHSQAFLQRLQAEVQQGSGINGFRHSASHSPSHTG